MRYLLALVLLFAAPSAAHSQWKNELFALGGIADTYNGSTFAGSFGFRMNPGWKHVYISFGSGIDFFAGGEGSYAAETGVGTGFKFETGKLNFKFGAEAVAILVLDGGVSNQVGLVPHASITHDIRGKEIGLMVKGNVSLTGGEGFIVGGLLLRLN